MNLTYKLMDDQNQNKNTNPLGELIANPQNVASGVQEELNKPLNDPTGVSNEDHAFMQDVISKLESGQINPLSPSSLINNEVYDKLSDELQGKVDINAMTILSNVRQIKDLHALGHMETYQAQNLVSSCRLMKERVEKECGDCYII